MSLTLNHQDKLTLRTAAYGAVTLLSAAGAAGGSRTGSPPTAPSPWPRPPARSGTCSPRSRRP
ncbi:hypothetical protein ACFQZ4_37365 [Catellatospora coxensis]